MAENLYCLELNKNRQTSEEEINKHVSLESLEWIGNLNIEKVWEWMILKFGHGVIWRFSDDKIARITIIRPDKKIMALVEWWIWQIEISVKK